MQIKSNSTTEKVVYFVRHGQSQGNAAPVFQAKDSPLSEKGFRQAEFIATRVSSVPFDKLIASPLKRSCQTAEIISKAVNKSITFSDLFVERIKPSSIDGKYYADSSANNVWRRWEESLVTSGKTVEDGENYEQIVKRADQALDYLKQQSEKTLVVVTHGYFLHTLIARVLLTDSLTSESFKKFQRVVSTENTGVTAMVYEGVFEQEPCWRLRIYNDHAHLADLVE